MANTEQGSEKYQRACAATRQLRPRRRSRQRNQEEETKGFEPAAGRAATRLARTPARGSIPPEPLERTLSTAAAVGDSRAPNDRSPLTRRLGRSTPTTPPRPSVSVVV
ncbi:protein ORF60 [Pigeon adenovirus 1]